LLLKKNGWHACIVYTRIQTQPTPISQQVDEHSSKPATNKSIFMSKIYSQKPKGANGVTWVAPTCLGDCF
jgi:hypothetical protein